MHSFVLTCSTLQIFSLIAPHSSQPTIIISRLIWGVLCARRTGNGKSTVVLYNNSVRFLLEPGVALVQRATRIFHCGVAFLARVFRPDIALHARGLVDMTAIPEEDMIVYVGGHDVYKI